MTEHNNIASALAAAQLEMGKALKTATNPHFKSKYADLSSVMDASLEPLNKHGIAVTQVNEETEFGRCVRTVFTHTSGEKLENPIPLIIGKDDMQGLGSAITYARRYGLMGLAGIAPEDDDGNAASKSAPKQLSWSQTIIKELPDSATDKEKAEAIRNAILQQWKRKKTAGELANEWDRRKALIAGMEDKFKDMHEEIVEAYEARIIEVEPIRNTQ